MLHWLNIELWGPMWPNLASSAIAVVPSFLWAHRKMIREIEKRDIIHRKRHHELLQAVREGRNPAEAGLDGSGT